MAYYLQKTTIVFSVILLLLTFGTSLSAQQKRVSIKEPQSQFSHQIWDALLKKNVRILENGSVTQLDYYAMAKDRQQLKSYLHALAQVSKVDYGNWHESQRLAFLINAYNAWTVEFILTQYPHIESIKELGSLFSSPWKKEFIPLLGDTVSLDNIEQDMIRVQFNEPRIHFAVNCASIGCPALRPEAYIAEQLNRQLDSATRLFLSDKNRNRLSGDELQLSKIFSWYQNDFEKEQSLAQFLIKYSSSLGLNVAQQQALLIGDIKVEYLDYNWQLNKVQ